ncbi:MULTISPECIES: NAD(+)--rifampin ADP-ribosyltransferase [unclassified Nocardioides]|uniref:NAD(+)--rifampin ADP-ribosyltransferase n=1 Tax=unclassified Nocardioides TaxID=2615069 RepID=UPI003620AFC1
MCQSVAAGGQRCAASTRPAFCASIDAVNTAISRRAQAEAQAIGVDAVVAHFATPTGAREVGEMIEQAESAGDTTLADFLRLGREAARTTAATRREVDEAVDVQIRLYHGSPAMLGPGDVLRPGTAETSPYRRDEPHVYVTDSATEAAQWAADANEMRGGDGPVYVYEVDAPGAVHQPHEDDHGQHVVPSATVVRRVR